MHVLSPYVINTTISRDPTASGWGIKNYNKIILEIKTTNIITDDHQKQLIRYLEAANLKLGLIVNFRQRPLEIRRVLNRNIRIIRGADEIRPSA